MTDKSGRHFDAWPKWLAGVMCLFAMLFGDLAQASAETRSLKLYFVHTREKAEIVFKRNGRYDRAGLKRINMFLRDWRRNEPTNMDPRLLDVVWEAYRQSGSRDYIHVVSAYRSPATNSMLRSRSRGVAKKSQHMLGKAMDWYLPDVKLKQLRNIGLKMQAGGVGYYPSSGSPFVHFDVGRVRHWPGISRSELASVFPNGKTLHVPSDGKPLPGYEQAMAAYKVRESKGELAIASLTKGNNSTTKKRSGGLLAAWFGGGADQEEDDGESAMPVAKAVPAKAVAARQVDPEPEIAIKPPAAVKPAGRQPEITVLPPELAAPANRQPTQMLQEPSAPQEPAVVEDTPETIIAALPARKVPTPFFAPRPQVEVGPAATASEVAALIENEATALPVAEAAPAEAGIAVADTAPADDAQVAANVPLPAWRPDYKAAPEADNAAALLALANVPQESTPVPGLRPQTASLATTQSRPGTDGSISSSNTDEIRVAVIPSSAPRAQHTASTAQPATTVTTAKAGRVKAAAKPAEAKPQVVAALPQSARWALDQSYVAGKQPRARTANGTAQTIVRTAPMEVYTAGFQRGDAVTNPHRFTGKAVEFLSVAKFN